MALNDKKKDPDAPEREGDVLGISDSNPNVKIPSPPSGGGHPAGIEVREHATGYGDVSRSSGATGIDMGAGGEGTDIARDPSRPRSAEDQEE